MLIHKVAAKYAILALGKKIGGHIYVHRTYEGKVVPADILKAAKKLIGNFKYHVVKWSPKETKVSFIESPDFDTADEPVIGRCLSVKDGKVTEYPKQADPWIYHHKWQFVEPDYRGFSVAESKERSKSWEAIPGIDKARIGKKSYWALNKK
jgi:hypothetical protein